MSHEICLLRVQQDEVLPYLGALRLILAADETARSERYLRPHDRVRSVLSRGLLRVLLGSMTGIAPGHLCFATGPAGKPELAGEPDWQFSVSHSGDDLLLAVTRGRAIGVDIEEVNERVDLLGIADSCFHPAEVEWLYQRQGAERLRAFFALWTCKEAVVKATGRGLQIVLRSFAVQCGEEFAPAAFEEAESQIWAVCNLSVPGNYQAALAVECAPEAAIPVVRWLSLDWLVERLRAL